MKSTEDTLSYNTKLYPESEILGYCSGFILTTQFLKCHINSMDFKLFVYKGMLVNSIIFKVI